MVRGGGEVWQPGWQSASSDLWSVVRVRVIMHAHRTRTERVLRVGGRGQGTLGCQFAPRIIPDDPKVIPDLSRIATKQSQNLFKSRKHHSALNDPRLTQNAPKGFLSVD